MRGRWIGCMLIIVIIGSIPFVIASQELGDGIESDVIITSSMVGTSIDHESMTVNLNVEGEITLRTKSDGYCDIHLCFNYLSCLEKESKSIPIVKKVSILPDRKQIVTLDISDYYEGTFLSIRFLVNKSLSLYVATEYDEIQYSAHVLIDSETIGLIEIRSLLDSYVQCKSNEIRNRTIAKWFENENAPSTIPQVRSLQDSVPEVSDSFVLALEPPVLEPRIYFLNHYMAAYGGTTVLAIGQVLIDNSWITHELAREDPTISQVKSDLKFCSKKYYYKPDWYSKTIGAYMVGAHGGYDTGTHEIYWICNGASVYSSDVRSCWISTDTYYCRPDSCIITCLSCYSLYYTTMGDAFMDYNARAYVGGPDTISGNQNEFVEKFWGDHLAIGNTDIDYALAHSGSTAYQFDYYYASCGDRTLPN